MTRKSSPRKRTKKHPYLYGCVGCGDITTGCVSESTGLEYDCCWDCAERVDAMVAQHGPAFEGQAIDDTGPYRPRKRFPPCPECGSKDVEVDQAHLECQSCEHEWTPDGIYEPEPLAVADAGGAK